MFERTVSLNSNMVPKNSSPRRQTWAPAQNHQQVPDSARPTVFYLVPTDSEVGITSIALGLFRALDREGLDVGFFKPISRYQPHRAYKFLRAEKGSACVLPTSIDMQVAKDLLNADNIGQLLQDVVERFNDAFCGENNSKQFVIVQGLKPQAEFPELETLNQRLVKALDAEVIVVTTLDCNNVNGFVRFEDKMDHTVHQYGGFSSLRTLGCIINKVDAPVSHISGEHLDQLEDASSSSQCDLIDRLEKKYSFFQSNEFCLIGAIPWDQKLQRLRTCDYVTHLGANVLYEGDMTNRRVLDVKIVARSVKHMVHILRPETLVITPGDRDDIILAVCMAALNGVPLAGLVLTGLEQPDPGVLELVEKAFEQGLPLLTVEGDSYVIANKAANICLEVPSDDRERIEAVMNSVADNINLSEALAKRLEIPREPRMSPSAFMYNLVKQARAANRRIILPEGNDVRVIRAAAICNRRRIARCTLLGDPIQIHKLAEAQGIDLPFDVEIKDPNDAELRQKYAPPMVELRKHKGVTLPSALAQLEDVTVMATMMLSQGDADGLVSGAAHSTANTVRPALQLIKTNPTSSIISSIFFMCLPDQVLVYGDCAINPDPNAEQLAEIAIQSADSAEAFGIEPRIAMISYSTGTSGKGCDVDKVREATKIVQQRRPDLLIDGPLQYDAASTPDVAKQKAPNSKVAGRATGKYRIDLSRSSREVEKKKHILLIIIRFYIPLHDFNSSLNIPRLKYRQYNLQSRTKNSECFGCRSYVTRITTTSQ